MLSHAKNTLINGGTFNTTFNSSGNQSLSAFERLEKATAHAGFHNSIDRPDPPRCHPRTRLAIQAQIKAWILRQEDRDVNMMWLTGGAGAGKSAIAQCIAEQCEKEKRLAAGFFFGRSDPTRNDGRKLIATIVYQICLNIFGIRELVESAINHDPLIFTRSLASQMKALIIDPLQQLQINGSVNLTNLYIVIIDGLDECQDRDIQCSILTTIADALSQANLPLLFLVASRPESHLMSTMASKKLEKLHTRRILDETLSPDQDIEIFLRESFDEIKETHPLRSYIPSSWPSDHDIYFLVRKASGHFIYASVVIKYVKSPRRRPKDCLETILGLRPNLRDDAPFAELDMLYHHILADVDDIEMVMHILSFLLFRGRGFIGSVAATEDFLGLSPGDIRFYLDSLISIVTFGGKEEDYSVNISHASFEDFLRDKARSNQFFMDPPVRYEALARRCFHHLKNTAPIYSDEVCTPDVSEIELKLVLEFESFWYSQLNVETFCAKSIPTPELCIDISEFSLLNVQAISKQFASEARSFQVYAMWRFVSSIETLKIEDAEVITNRHMQDMRTITIKMIEDYYANTGLTTLLSIFNIIRLHIYKNIYVGLHTMLSLGGQFYLDSFNLINIAMIFLDRDSNTNVAKYFSFLQECVEERKRNATHPLDHGKYTVAALHLLQFLSSHLGKYEAHFHPRYSCHDLNLRRKYPWKWRRKRFGIHGTLTWSRLNHWRSFKSTGAIRDIETLCDPKNYVNTKVFRHEPGFDSCFAESEAYKLAVKVLPYLLNRSDYNEALFHLAETIVFPFQLTKHSEDDAVQRAVQKYLRHWSTSF